MYKIERKEHSYQEKILDIEGKLKEWKKKFNSVVNNNHNEICNHCGAEYNKSNIQKLKNRMLELKEVYVKEKTRLTNECVGIIRSINEKNNISEEMRSKISKREKELKDFEDRCIHLQRDRIEYKKYVEEQKSRDKLTLEIKNKKNPFIKKMKLVKKKLIISKQELAKISSRIILLNKKIKDSEYAIEAFGNSGIKNDIISTKIDLLEEKINYYLSKISNGNIYVQLDNKVQRGQGERIGIMIQDSKKTKPLDYNEWSGGEKTKIRFAVEWAINSILESNIDLLIVDEGFDFLSEIGIKAIMDVMKQETQKKIISVSNVVEMKEMFKNKIVVELKDNCSHVTQLG